MELTGSQFKQIQEALLAAFDEASLRRMVRVGLGEELRQVSGGENLTEIVSNLVTWAERQNQVQELIDAAVDANPSNTKLQVLQQAAQSWHVAPPGGSEEPEPYKGLDYFDVSDADLFFGRNRLTAELVTYLCDHRLLAVVGASGSGKSSLVRAGIVPALRTGKHLHEDDKRPAGSQRWPLHILTPTAHPLKELSASLTYQSESVTAQTTLMDDMGRDARSLDLYTSRLLARIGEGGSRPERLLLIIDQFEELFTLCGDRDKRRAFVDNLLTAADGVTTVVLTLRADFYAHCAQFDNLRQALESSQRYIGAMSEEELRLAIEAPAQQGGWDLEPGLVDLMLEDVADEPGALPLLSHALLETWKRRSGRMLTLAGYQAAGRVQGAIAKTADNTLAGLTPPQQAIARSIFLRLTALGEGVQDMRRRVLLDEVMPGPAAATDVVTVLQRLQTARLVTTVREEEPVGAAGASVPITYVDVAHEALIREWPVLREWLAEDREGLRVHRRLTEAAHEWERLGKDPGALHRGLRLAQTLAWAKGHTADLNEQERAFLEASQALVEAEQAERERIAREREEIRQRELEAAHALATEAEARRRAEEERAQEAEARRQAETTRAEEAEASAQRALEQAQALEREAEARAAEEVRARKYARRAFGAALVAFVLAAAVGWFLYQQNLKLRGASLLREARAASEARDVETAIAKFTAAAQADPALGIDVAKEISETLRSAALYLIYEGEQLAAQGNVGGTGEKFEEALALKPPPDTPVYVWIQEGEFLMGSDPAVDSLAQDNEFDRHPVYLDAYWIMRTEVTNEQYARCVEAGVCQPPANERWHRAEYAREPLTNVDWYQAGTYAAWVGGQLPTEAEWEKACRGTDGRIYPWGNEELEPTRLNYYDSGLNRVVQVGSYPPGANGLLDMAGNVWEWTSSKYQSYPYDAQDGREDPEGNDERIVRGGSWSFADLGMRCAIRGRGIPNFHRDNFGFRVVVSPGF